MPNRQNMTDTENLLNAIPKILLWTWGSLFLGMVATFVMTIFLGQATGLQIRVIPTLVGTHSANTRVRGGGRIRRPSDTRPELVTQGRKILRTAVEND